MTERPTGQSPPMLLAEFVTVLFDRFVRGAFLGAGIATGAVFAILFMKDWGLMP